MVVCMKRNGLQMTTMYNYLLVVDNVFIAKCTCIEVGISCFIIDICIVTMVLIIKKLSYNNEGITDKYPKHQVLLAKPLESHKRTAKRFET